LPDLSGLAQVKELVAAGRKDQAIHVLLQLAEAHPERGEIPYFLGRLYLDKLWWHDGLKAYRRAIELDPSFRTYEPLIRSVLRGFVVTPEHHPDIAEFLRSDIGDAARPYLQETAQEHPRAKVRKRAARELERMEQHLAENNVELAQTKYGLGRRVRIDAGHVGKVQADILHGLALEERAALGSRHGHAHVGEDLRHAVIGGRLGVDQDAVAIEDHQFRHGVPRFRVGRCDSISAH
jgi:tetratricopeptide (TPR) repeat protein